jgi:hypothetical protein
MKNPLTPDADLTCPACTAADIKALGTRGFAGRHLLAVLFGFFAGAAFGRAEQKNTGDRAIIYKCTKCGKKWEALPGKIAASGCLETPCEIHVIRESSVIGCAMVQFVYLNGRKIGPVKNGEHISFTTEQKHNLVFVTDHLGRSFDTRRFEAPAGKQTELRFKRKFL